MTTGVFRLCFRPVSLIVAVLSCACGVSDTLPMPPQALVESKIASQPIASEVLLPDAGSWPAALTADNFSVQVIETLEPWDSVVAEDMDGDGVTDLIGTGLYTPNIHAIFGRRDAAQLAASVAFEESTNYPPLPARPFEAAPLWKDHVRPLCVADMNGDGKCDVVYALDQPSRLRLLTNDGTGRLGGLQEATDIPEIWGLAAGDLDGDGGGDIVCGHAASWTTSLTRIDVQAGRMSAERRKIECDLPTGAGKSSKPMSLLVADTNGDGRLDILGVEGVASLAFTFVQDSAGEFAGSHVDVQYGFSEALCRKDIDGDGLPDLVCIQWGFAGIAIVSGAPGAAVTHVEAGLLPPDGAATAHSLQASGWPFSVEALDVNGDGRLEVLIPYLDRNSLGIVFLDRDFGLQRVVEVPVCDRPWALAVGDVDGDGRDEIAVTSRSSNRISIVGARSRKH